MSVASTLAECRDLKQELHKRNVEASDELKTDLKMAKKRETEFHQKQANFIAVMEKELTRELNNIKCTANVSGKLNYGKLLYHCL